MRPDDLLKLLRAQPFRPFRISMSDGKEFDVRHPDNSIVDRSTVFLGVPGRRGPEGPVERVVICALVHITRVEYVDGAAMAS